MSLPSTDLNELTSLVYQLLSCLAISCSTEIKAECEKLNSLKNVTDPLIIINQLRRLIVLVNDGKSKKHSLTFCLSEYKAKHLKNIYETIQDDLDKIDDTGELNISGLKVQLKTLFEDFQHVLHVESENIIELGRQVTQLEEEKKKAEKFKIIGNLLMPLSKEIHTFLDTLVNQPHQYDDPSIYKAMQGKSMENLFQECEYKNSFEKLINEETYEQYYSWLLNKAAILNVPICQLLTFLWMKKARNFTCHSDIIDFFSDSRTSFKYNLSDLLKKHDVMMNPNEYDALNQIYLVYYRHIIEDIKMLETRTNAPV